MGKTNKQTIHKKHLIKTSSLASIKKRKTPTTFKKSAEKNILFIKDELKVNTNLAKSSKNKLRKPKKHTTPGQYVKLQPNIEADTSSAYLDVKQEDFTNFESKFNVKVKDIRNAIEGVIKVASQSETLKRQILTDQIPIMLQINSFKVPKGISKVLRIPLTTPIITTEDDICLIIPEVKGINNIDHEKHIEHYQNLLHNKGVFGIKRLMTLHEFRTEYETFELKSRLVELYDCFLVDGRISGKVVKKCGKVFYKKRKLPTPVKLQASNLSKHIDDMLRRVFFHLHLKSNSYCVQFGHSNMKVNELIGNVYSVLEFLSQQFPGGMDNVQNLNVFSTQSVSVPIYVSLRNPNEIPVPKVLAKRPKMYITVEDELSTRRHANVKVYPTGRVIVQKNKKAHRINPKINNKHKNIKKQSKTKINKQGTKK